MAFEKGNTYGKGRPKGSKNRNTKKIQNFFFDFLDNNVEKLNDAFEELEAKDKFKVILDMTKYVIPALRAQRHYLEELSEEDFNKIVEQIKQEFELV